MPTPRDFEHDVVLTEAAPLDPALSPAAAQGRSANAFRRAAMIAGAAYLITDATSIFGILVRSSLIVSGDAARTASNIAMHAQLFRLGIVSDLLTGAGVVILNLALYELLAPVHRSLARLAAFWRLAEVAIGSAITSSSFVVLSLVSGAAYVQAFQPRELQALVHLYVGAQASGYMIMLLFFSLGSTTYMYLLVRSRYVPKLLASLGLAGSALLMLFTLTRMLFPALAAAGFAAVLGLPGPARVLLALVFVPVLAFEILLGLWLLVKGGRVREHA